MFKDNQPDGQPSYARGGAVGDDDDYIFGAGSSASDDPDYDPSNREDNAQAGSWRQPLGSNAGVPDKTTDKISSALQVVNQAMMYGRKKHGLPTDDEAIQTGGEDSAVDTGTPSFEDGGAVPDENNEDNFGAPPVVQNAPDNSGAAPAVPDAQTAGGAIDTGSEAIMQPVGSRQNAPHQMLQRGAQAVMAYLKGSDAASPEDVQALKGPEGAIGGNPDADNVMAIAKASEAGGPDAAFKVIQYNRQRYDAFMSHALAAATGSPQRGPDLRAAAESATQAYQFMPDGTRAQFTAGPNGITATVSPWGKQPSTYNLTPQQFAQVTNIAKDGQFDTVYEKGGVGAVLSELAKQAPQAGAQPAQGAPQKTADTAKFASQINAVGQKPAGQNPVQDENSTAYRNKREGSREMNMGYDVTTLHAPGYNQRFPQSAARGQSGQDKINPAEQAPNENDSNVVRAERAYPGVGQASQRARYRDQADQKDNANENRLAIAKTQAGGRTESATIRGDASRDVQTSRNEGGLAVQGKKNEGFKYNSDAKVRAVQIATDQKAAAAGNKDAQARIESARKDIEVIRQTGGTLTPEQTETAKLLNQRGQQALQGQGASTQQQAPQRQAPQASPGAPPVQGAKFYKGQWYTRGANGEAVPYQQ